MRSFARPALLALSLAALPATATAAPFDGAENAGSNCVAQFATAITTGTDHIGVIQGGPWVAADVVATRNGIVGIESSPGPVTDLKLTCTIHERYVGGPEVVRASSTFPGTGVVTLVPAAFAFESYYDQFWVCTEVTWRDGAGELGGKRSCIGPLNG